MTYISEKYQLGMLLSYLVDRKFEYVTEGLVYSIPIDILALRGNDLISIEMKSRNLKKGVSQASRNTVFSDYSYISVWDDQVTDYFLNSVEETPIGVIAVDDNARIIKEPTRLNPNEYAKSEAKAVIKQ